MHKNNVYGVVLSKEIAAKARVIAAMQGMSRSKLIRILLENYLVQPTPPLTHLVPRKPEKSRNKVKNFKK